MAFNPQQIQPIDQNPNKAVGVEIPFNGPAVFKSTYLTKDAIKNNLVNFFLTNPGDRYLNPIFGGGLRKFIFEKISTNNTEFLIQDISEKISLYFPTIKVESLEVGRIEYENTIKISLSYSVINTNIVDNIEIEFN